MKACKVNLEHYFYCTQCGEKGIPSARNKGQYKKPGHLKKLYCRNCKKEINHVECIEYSSYDSEMFQTEFLSGNFKTDGSRIVELSQWRRNYHHQKAEE